MTTPEDKLAALLREQAETVVPSGGGLATIQARVARKRRTRWVLPGSVVVTAAAVAVLLAVSSTGTRSSLQQVPGGTPEPSGSPVGIVEPSPTTDPLVGKDLYADATWPFTSQAQAEAWRKDRSSMPWAGDKVAVAQHFVDDFLGLTDVTVDPQCPECFEKSLLGLGMKSHEGSIGDLALGGATAGPFSVFNVTLDGLTFTSPSQFEQVSSPLTVTGNIVGVDENIALRLIASDGRTLASAAAPAGSGAPWSATLSWSQSDWSHAVVVGVTRSAKDGSVNRVVAQPVQRRLPGAPSPTPSPGPSFAGVEAGHVNLYDSATGKVLRQLTYPHGQLVDTDASYAAGSLLWLRAQQTGCNDGLYQLVENRATTVVAPGKVHLGTPRLSRDGRWGAWLETACDGSTTDLAVQKAGGSVRRISVPHGILVRVLDVDVAGAVLIRTGDAVTAFESGATSFSEGVSTGPESGCTMTDAVVIFGPPSRPGQPALGLFGFERCANGVRMFNNSDGTAHPNGPLTAADQVLSMSLGSGGMLVSYRQTAGGPVLVATYSGNVPAEAGFSQPIISDGSVRSPSW
ncbi:MAG: hypothetical protein QOG99_1319 [Frankiales bacterium]|jgi:hypothetical protein|nr:hypothetical protein [Frankiales bacterium]